MMKSITIACAIATGAMSFSGVAFAQNDDRREWREQRREARQDRREDRREDRHERRDDRRDDRRDARQDRRDWRDHAAQQQHYVYTQPRHQSYGWQHVPRARYYTGAYLPHQYRHQTYYVNDWHSHNLYAPPYGHQWVQTDAGEFMLVAIATGLIANLLLSR